MYFLANENFPLDAIEALKAQGHDVAWVHTDAPGSSDEQVLAYANREKRILLTFDKDFGELAFHTGLKADCGIMLFRVPTPSSRDLANTVVAVVQSRQDRVGHFTVADEHHIRMRPLP
jgi:predicted nuclease of predicted toxin-antitoxin system